MYIDFNKFKDSEYLNYEFDFVGQPDPQLDMSNISLIDMNNDEDLPFYDTPLDRAYYALDEKTNLFEEEPPKAINFELINNKEGKEDELANNYDLNNSVIMHYKRENMIKNQNNINKKDENPTDKYKPKIENITFSNEINKINNPYNNEKISIKLKPSENSSSSKSKSTTKGSSNSGAADNNNTSNIINNNKKLFKLEEVPDNFFGLYMKLDMSSNNLYYKPKKKKMREKVKEKIKEKFAIKKDLKIEDFERPLYRKFKTYLKKNKDQKEFKNIFDNDRIFWDLFLGEKKNYSLKEKEFIKNHFNFKEYNQNSLLFIFQRNDVLELYKEFKDNFINNKIKKSPKDDITFKFYIKYLDDLYNNKVKDLEFEDEWKININLFF